MPSGGRGGPPSLVRDRELATNIFLIGEAGKAVPWTKPEDIPYDTNKPIPALGGQFAKVSHVAFCDGTVRALPKTIEERWIRAGMVGGSRGWNVNWDGSHRPVESPVQQKLLGALRVKNVELVEEATILKEILGEVKSELKLLRWTLEQDKMLAADPKAAALKKTNEQLEKSIKEGRDEARKLMQELREVKDAMRKKSEK